MKAHKTTTKERVSQYQLAETLAQIQLSEQTATAAGIERVFIAKKI